MLLKQASIGSSNTSRSISLLPSASVFSLLLSPALRISLCLLLLSSKLRTWQLTYCRSNPLSLPGPHFPERDTNWSNLGQLPRYLLLTSIVPRGHCCHLGFGLKLNSWQKERKMRKESPLQRHSSCTQGDYSPEGKADA